jgi:hypothetical protein
MYKKSSDSFTGGKCRCLHYYRKIQHNEPYTSLRACLRRRWRELIWQDDVEVAGSQRTIGLQRNSEANRTIRVDGQTSYYLSTTHLYRLSGVEDRDLPVDSWHAYPLRTAMMMRRKKQRRKRLFSVLGSVVINWLLLAISAASHTKYMEVISSDCVPHQLQQHQTL